MERRYYVKRKEEEMINLNETKKETKFKLTLFGAKRNIFTFAIGTPENPMGKSLSKEENEYRCKQFETQLKELKLYAYKEKGRYNTEETSYLIANINLEQCIYLFGKRMFDQESFIYARVNNTKERIEYSYYKINENHNEFELKGHQTVAKVLNQDTLDYYTQYKNFKFNIPFDPRILEKTLNKLSEEIDNDFRRNKSYRDLLKHVALSEGYTLKHYWEFNKWYLLTEKQSKYNKDKLIEYYKTRNLDGIIEGMNLRG